MTRTRMCVGHGKNRPCSVPHPTAPKYFLQRILDFLRQKRVVRKGTATFSVWKCHILRLAKGGSISKCIVKNSNDCTICKGQDLFLISGKRLWLFILVKNKNNHIHRLSDVVVTDDVERDTFDCILLVLFRR